MKEVLRKYRDFPAFRAPEILLSAAYQTFPIFLLAFFFGPASAGFYALTRRVLGAPVTLLGKAVGDVYYARLSDSDVPRDTIRQSLSRATRVSALVAAPPFLAIGVFSPSMFGHVFGAAWIPAGSYARWLSLWLFFEFVNRASISAIPVLRVQGAFLTYQATGTAVRLAVLGTAAWVANEEVLTIAAFSIASAVVAGGIVPFTFLAARRAEQNLG